MGLSEWQGIEPGAAAKQRVPLDEGFWRGAVESTGDAHLVEVFAELSAHAEGSDGIARDFLFSLADDEDWAGLHLASVIWGSGRAQGHDRPVELAANAPRDARRRVCEGARTSALDGWNALWPENRRTSLPGLRVSMGTKLLYFAGYRTSGEPRPLIFDKRVHASLAALGYSFPSPGGQELVRGEDDYLRYLSLCEEAASEAGVEADDVEASLFLADGQV